MPEREGQRLGNYRLGRLLGRGAFAEVYLGEHLYLKNHAALKILRTVVKNEKEEQLFLSEAQTLAQLTHPNIIHVREFAVTRSTPFVAMDYVPGGTLRHRYPTGSCLSLEETVTYTKQIASALQYAHNHNIIHRDVKPENVLLGRDHVMLSDFGISIYAPSPNAATSQAWAGTIPYMSPEQLLGQPVFASDQYSLAVMVYEWLCGVRPFEGSSTGLAYQHINVPPPRLREKDPSLPEAVETVVLKALSKKPEDRYVSVINFARALERVSREAIPDIQTEIETELDGTPPRSTPLRVFLSSSSLDDVTRLKTDLSIREISVQEEGTSEPQEEKLRQTMRAVRAVLLVLTPQTRSSAAVKEHLRMAAIYRRKVLCVWAKGEELRDLLPASAEQAVIIDARGQKYQQAVGEIITSLERERRGSTTIEPIPSEPEFEPRNPYKGLRAFTQNDRADFFGRTAVVQELLNTLKKTIFPITTEQNEARFLAVVGPSGSGKSSVVMAGLLPRLQDGALPESNEWVYLDPIIPGKQPVEALARILAPCFPGKGPQAVFEVLRREGGMGLHQLGFELMRGPQTRVVLLIDQFEELFSPDIAPQERQHFIDLLVAAATEPRGALIILITLRADFYDRPFAYPALGRLIQHAQCAILPMEVEDLREVIERPSLLPDVRLAFDEDLVGDLLFDMRGQIGALPLLEFTLDQLFHLRRGHRLTQQAYQEIGGVRGALSKHAESTYESLPSEQHHQLARTLFMRLAQPGAAGQEPVRRRADASELILEHAEQTRMLREVADVFIAARLVTMNQSTGMTTLEISHEALIREWPRLTNWLQEASEDIHLQQTMGKDVTEWERRGKPKDRLYRGSQLKESLAWRKRNVASSSEAAFLRASTARRMRARISFFLVAVLILGLLGTAGLLFQQQYAPVSVTTLKDGAPGSLRQAVTTARPGGTIVFASNLKGVMTLNNSLDIDKNLTILGPGVNVLTLRGTRDRAYLIQIDVHSSVTISHLMFSDPTAQNGPVINNMGNLTLDGCSITGNMQVSSNLAKLNAADGGGVMNDGGALTLKNSVVSHNTVQAGDSFGGGVNGYKGSITIINSQISDNTAIATGQLADGGGITTINSKLTLINTIVTGNSVKGGQQVSDGGGIASSGGTITLTDSTITHNSISGATGTAIGGGFEGIGDTISISNSTISNNSVASSGVTAGGGISSENGDPGQNGHMTITNTTVSHNTTESSQNNSYGGGIYDSATLAITDSIISDNTVNASTTTPFGVAGGGIDTTGTLNLNRTTIIGNMVTNNQGEAEGGGLIAGTPNIANPTLNLTNCTIANNTVQGNTQGSGGGFDLHRANGSMDFCTVYGNTASSNGGGISIETLSDGTIGTLALKNSLVAGNNAGMGPDIAGPITTGGYNLVQNLSDVQFNDPANKHHTDLSGDRYSSLHLDTQLRNNGGPTPTIALQQGSPAIDAIPTASCDVSTDQRGVKRPQHNACDIGAYEYEKG